LASTFGIDGQNAGKLRVFFQNLGKEAGAYDLVVSDEITGPRQTEVKLGGSLDSRIEARCDGARGACQAADRDVYVPAAVLVISQAHKDGRQQRGCQNQQ
jgi:hypothetical protein